MPFFEMVRAYIKTTSDLDFLVFSPKEKGRSIPSPRRHEKRVSFFSKEQFHEHHEAEANHERGKAEMLDAFL